MQSCRLGQFERERGGLPEFRVARGEPIADRSERRRRRDILRRGLDPALRAPGARRAQPGRGPLAGPQRAPLEPFEPARDAHVLGRERAQHRTERDQMDFQIADRRQVAAHATQIATGAPCRPLAQDGPPQRERGLEPARGDAHVVRRLGAVRAQSAGGDEKRLREMAQPLGRKLDRGCE